MLVRAISSRPTRLCVSFYFGVQHGKKLSFVNKLLLMFKKLLSRCNFSSSANFAQNCIHNTTKVAANICRPFCSAVFQVAIFRSVGRDERTISSHFPFGKVSLKNDALNMYIFKFCFALLRVVGIYKFLITHFSPSY
uniref:(northern house mosquito) hypothetical protein n=1 Tax=Culex pipiens TaxID=7175 RepID=A0A8D8CU68_CULPI